MPDTSTRTADESATGDDLAAAGARPRRAGRLLRHEWTLASAGSVLLAVLMIWIVPPFASWLVTAGDLPNDVANPLTTIVGDNGDPTAQAWLIAWNGHALLHEPARLWTTNAFYPGNWALAFSDSLFGYAPAGLIGEGATAAVLRYNIVFVLAFALASLGMYALARQLGANRIGSAVAGAAFAYAPWRYGHDGHLNILSTGGIALALAMLARGHGWSLTRGYRPERARPGWALAGWMVAAWQISLGFGVGLPFFYLLALAVVLAFAGWLLAGRPRLSRRLVLSDLAGGAVFAGVSGYFAYAYQQVRELHPQSARSWDYIAMFSPPPRGLVIAPDSSLPWGDWHEAARTSLGAVSNEKVLFCGAVLYALAVAGLFLSVWPRYTRAFLGAGVLLGILFVLGTNGPAFKLLWWYLPGFDGSRTPGRLILWPTLLLCLLAAGMVTALAQAVRRPTLPRYAPLAIRVVTVPLLLAVLMEGLPRLDHAPIPAEPAAMAAATAPMMVLPSDESVDLNIQLWSTNGFPVMVNGASSLIPRDHQAIRDLMKTFPSAPSVERLRQLGVRSVVVLRDWVNGSDYQSALGGPTTGLGITRTEIGPDVLYTIS